ncbi:hypothetical protein ABS71_20870 [bacterium SCN 62-11]|nr:SMI1/KNR4 family protein [Candidatus Eremiobacteraeota bacterium]ODT57026.1 MAG: hypothetical protein ABS71_20870 [bacterium SCN 62-11]
MSDFSDVELQRLRACGVVIFADRVIFDAQPPISSARLAEVAAQCAGPLPAELLELWALTAGGSLDYNLTLEMAGNQEAISWTELFYHDSDGYHDLPGWMEHEQELAPGPLRYLPIGGFEYCDRIYVRVEPDSPDSGEVVAWKMGLPPGWQHALHRDAIATVASGLQAAFGRLWVGEESGDLQGFLEESELEPELTEKVMEFYGRARPDWRGAIHRKQLAGDSHLLRLALHHALEHRDLEVLRQVAEAGADWTRPVRGSALPTEVAMQFGSLEILEALLDLGAPVSEAMFRLVGGELPEVLARRLLQAGARADADGLVRCWVVGARDAAKVLAERVTDYEPTRQKMLARLNEDLAKVRAKRLGHYLGEKGLQEQIDRLRVDLASP